MITSITFPLLNEKLLVLTVYHPPQTYKHDDPRWGRHVDLESNRQQSSLVWSQNKNLRAVSLFIQKY